MSNLPLLMVLLGFAMTLSVGSLGARFWLNPERGMAFATHRPEVVAFAFAVTGIGPLHDAWVYYRAGQPFRLHLIPAALSALVAIWALMPIPNAGAV